MLIYRKSIDAVLDSTFVDLVREVAKKWSMKN